MDLLAFFKLVVVGAIAWFSAPFIMVLAFLTLAFGLYLSVDFIGWVLYHWYTFKKKMTNYKRK
jgi:hypothetical protein